MTINKKFIIAIDGFSSTGKSTLAKELAKKLGFLYMDTGAMYRAVTYYAMKNNIISDNKFNKRKLIDTLGSISIGFKFNPENNISRVFLNGENIENKIRSMEVSNFVSEIAMIPEVREKLVTEQRKIAKDRSVVMDGRDIGSIVFPNADFKIFMTAEPEVRAERRYKELIDKGEDVSYDSVLKNVIERDKKDSEREVSPLIKTQEAIEIDNSNLTKEQQLKIILNLLNKKGIS